MLIGFVCVLVLVRIAATWSYDNVAEPTYAAMPSVPVWQRRFEEVFIPDDFVPVPAASPSSTSTSTSTSTSDAKGYAYAHLEVSELHRRDTEVERREVREVGRRRGEHDGRAGVWVEKEWEVLAVPERKRLFLFGSGRSPVKRVL